MIQWKKIIVEVIKAYLYIEPDDKIEKIIITENFLKWIMDCEKYQEEMNKTMSIIDEFRQRTNINFATLNINIPNNGGYL